MVANTPRRWFATPVACCRVQSQREREEGGAGAGLVQACRAGNTGKEQTAYERSYGDCRNRVPFVSF